MIQEIKFPTTVQAMVAYQEGLLGRGLRSDERGAMADAVTLINDAYDVAINRRDFLLPLNTERELLKAVAAGITQEPVSGVVRQWIEGLVWWIYLAWMIGRKVAQNGRA